MPSQPKDIRRDILWPFLVGCLIGTLAGSRVVLKVPTEFLPLPLGVFILTMTWLPQIKKKLWFPGRFLSLGFVQAFLTLFVGATGPLNMPFLIRAGLSRDQLVVTGAAFMTIVHLVKIITFGLLGFAFGPYMFLMLLMILAVISGSYAGTRLRHKVPEQLFLMTFKLLITLLAMRMIIKALRALILLHALAPFLLEGYAQSQTRRYSPKGLCNGHLHPTGRSHASRKP